MTCWQILKIPATADTRAIKRAYAQQLKHTRPDDNPTEFSQLRTAYEDALQEVQWGWHNDKTTTEIQDAQTVDEPVTSASPSNTTLLNFSPEFVFNKRPPTTFGEDAKSEEEDETENETYSDEVEDYVHVE